MPEVVELKEDTKFRYVLNLTLNAFIMILAFVFIIIYYRFYRNFMNFIRNQPNNLAYAHTRTIVDTPAASVRVQDAKRVR